MQLGNPNVTCIVGGQYGSEGKGVICGYLANEFDVAVRVGAPNAGHTLKVGENLWKMQQIPVAGLINPDIVMCIGAAGLINLTVLKKELDYITTDIRGRFFIDRNAGVLEEHHRKQEEEEKMFEGIGSTCEGVGAALRDKIRRKGGKFRTAKDVEELAPYIINVSDFINNLPKGKKVMIEGTQGYGLSLNHGPYPYCTSRDIIASSLLSDVGLAPSLCTETILVIRSYPIRVAGNSGPMHDEIDWKTVTKESGYPKQLHEQTTVTKRTRRVGRFDMGLVLDAIKANRPTSIALTFADYLWYGDLGKTDYRDLSNRTRSFVDYIEDATGVPVTLIKTGIEYEHIIDRRKGSKVFGADKEIFDEGANLD